MNNFDERIRRLRIEAELIDQEEQERKRKTGSVSMKRVLQSMALKSEIEDLKSRCGMIDSYNQKAPSYAEIMTVEDFKESCQSGFFSDYDGSGYPVRNGYENRKIQIYPSNRHDIPADATHISWYNK